MHNTHGNQLITGAKGAATQTSSELSGAISNTDIKGGNCTYIGLTQQKAEIVLKTALKMLNVIKDDHFYNLSIVSLGLIRGLVLDGTKGEFVLKITFTDPKCPHRANILKLVGLISDEVVKHFQDIFKASRIEVIEGAWKLNDLPDSIIKILQESSAEVLGRHSWGKQVVQIRLPANTKAVAG